MTLQKKRVNIGSKLFKNKNKKRLINIFLTIQNMNIKNPKDLHTSVLLEELVNSITVYNSKQNIIVDCTLGMWWHASEIIKKLNSWDIFIWFDADIRNLNIVREKLENESSKVWVKIFFINDNFSNLKINLEKLNISKITWIYYDLWISSLHVDEWERWFSFKLDGPLDMRFDTSVWFPASHIVNSYWVIELTEIFREYGEEPMSKKIAEKIFDKRKKWCRLTTTKELSDVIWEVSKFPKSKNRIFQALRIETNDELWTIKRSLKDAINLLEENWNIFVISFHSLEDRIVKTIFKEESKDCICNDIICSCWHKKQLQLINKKPILPTEKEITQNSRSRSAKARLAKKIK